MKTPRRAIATLSGLTLALTGFAVTAAHADTYDDFYAPTRASTLGGAFVTHPTDIAIDPQVPTRPRSSSPTTTAAPSPGSRP